jgi:hypothetical protein
MEAPRVIGFARTTLIGRVHDVQWAAEHGMARVIIPLKATKQLSYRVLFAGEKARLQIVPGVACYVEGSMMMDDGPAYLRAQRWRVLYE